MLSPVLEKTTSDTQYSNGKEVDLMTIDTDEEGALAQKYGVSTVSFSAYQLATGQTCNSLDRV
jgi:hypothetical protein